MKQTGPKAGHKAGLAGRVAVIIVDYKSEALTRRSLESLVRLGRPDLAFIVIDNGNCIDSNGLEADFSNTTVLRSEKNKGFAAGCNLGIAFAAQQGAASYLLLNPDTRAETDFVGPLLAVLAENPKIGMATPTILADSPNRQVEFGGGILNWWTGRPISVTGRRLESGQNFVSVPYATGCALMLRPQAVEDVGPIDEGYFLYFEDADYAQAFIGKGWAVAYVPQAEILHAASSVTGYQSALYVYCFARNRIRFMRQRARWHHRAAFFLYNSLVRAPGAMLVFGLLRRQPELVDAYLRGYFDGLMGRPWTNIVQEICLP